MSMARCGGKRSFCRTQKYGTEAWRRGWDKAAFANVYDVGDCYFGDYDTGSDFIPLGNKLEERKKCMRTIKEFLKEETGIGTVEMILILVVLIGLVIIFKKEITDLVNDIFKTITNKVGQIA